MKAILATLALMVLPLGLHAQSNIFGPDSIRIIQVEIFDEATGGCWTNISEVKTYVEDQLRLNGYEITGLQHNNGLHSEEETDRIMAPLNRLPPSLSESAINAIRNHVYVDNFYSVYIVVHATRRNAHRCSGSIEARLVRQVTDHDIGFLNVPFRTVGYTFVGQQNVNMQMFDLVKDFIKHIKEYK
jgi:hypothetical protein